MAPNTSVLFHPRKPPPNRRNPPANADAAQGSGTGSAAGTPTASPTKGQTQRPRPKVPRPKPQTDDTAPPPPPEGPFVEYKLMSSALNGWKYDVMKFDSRKPVDIMTWARPVKLNRKDLRRDDPSDVAGPSAPRAVGPMLGPDGKAVIGMDGKMVMVDAEGRPIRPGDTVAAGDAKGKEKASAAKKKFQKKTKQVFLVPDSVRQLRREERYPWVMEDTAGREVWVGAMEEVSKAETQAMFMPSSAEEFKFVPAHRWYKFQKKPSYHVPNLQEAEDLMKQIQKNKDPERWLLRKRNGQGPSDATAAMFKSDREGSIAPSGSLVHSASQSLGPGGRRLKAVDSGADLFGDDDEDGIDSKKKREYGQEGDLDEVDYDENPQDDDEQAEPDPDDEEAKELEERLKREYKSANKTREGYIDESEDDDDEPQLTGAGKDMRKLMKKHEKNGAYDDSDDERNPYASSEEEEPEEEPPQVPQGPAIIPPEPRQPSSRPTPQAPTKAPLPASATKPANFGHNAIVKTDNGSRATSPVPMPGHGGHSIVAKRATSPKMPKLKTNGPNRAGSPLAGTSRPTSPVGSPPAVASPILGSASPPSAAAGKPSNKRKAEEGGAGNSSKPKKRKAHPVDGELEDRMVIEWLRLAPNATTRDCIHHFTPYLTTEEKKTNFTKLVKEVAMLKNGVLVLRNAYRSASSAPEPAANGAA